MNSISFNLCWPTGPIEPQLGESDIHLWAASLQIPSERLKAFSAALSEEERERAARFKFEQLRHRFIAGRGILRKVLSRYLRLPPATLDFSCAAHGKPELKPTPNRDLLHFNLAHTGELAVLAVTRLGSVGIDVESVRPMKDVEDLVARFFSPRENALFQNLPETEKPVAFFNLWTRKEAWLKATGDGIAGGLHRVEVSFLPEEPARVLAIAGDSEAAKTWSLRAFNPAEGCVGAVAIRHAPQRIETWRFEGS